jgi:uncharacterized protein YqgV (UPF0045/DUF77 family)
LTRDYVPPIKDIIARLATHTDLSFEYNALSTQVRGEFDAVFDALKTELKTTFEGPDRAILVMKVLGGPVTSAENP